MTMGAKNNILLLYNLAQEVNNWNGKGELDSSSGIWRTRPSHNRKISPSMEKEKNCLYYFLNISGSGRAIHHMLSGFGV